MKRTFVAAGAGALFGLGLGVSGMTQPSKVLGFLDVFGKWDPTLMLVMMGALTVHFALARWINTRATPVFDDHFDIPLAARIDRRLVVGATVFGVGWGLGGFCPGPALVCAGSGAVPALVFTMAMAVGMAAHHVVHERSAATSSSALPMGAEHVRPRQT